MTLDETKKQAERFPTLTELLREGEERGRVFFPRHCEYCERLLIWEDQSCACTARRG